MGWAGVGSPRVGRSPRRRGSQGGLSCQGGSAGTSVTSVHTLAWARHAAASGRPERSLTLAPAPACTPCHRRGRPWDQRGAPRGWWRGRLHKQGGWRGIEEPAMVLSTTKPGYMMWVIVGLSAQEGVESQRYLPKVIRTLTTAARVLPFTSQEGPAAIGRPPPSLPATRPPILAATSLSRATSSSPRLGCRKTVGGCSSLRRSSSLRHWFTISSTWAGQRPRPGLWLLDAS